MRRKFEHVFASELRAVNQYGVKDIISVRFDQGAVARQADPTDEAFIRSARGLTTPAPRQHRRRRIVEADNRSWMGWSNQIVHFVLAEASTLNSAENEILSASPIDQWPILPSPKPRRMRAKISSVAMAYRQPCMNQSRYIEVLGLRDCACVAAA